MFEQIDLVLVYWIDDLVSQFVGFFIEYIVVVVVGQEFDILIVECYYYQERVFLDCVVQVLGIVYGKGEIYGDKMVVFQLIESSMVGQVFFVIQYGLELFGWGMGK